MIAALDGTPLTEPTGGVARYTSELTRALALGFPDDQYWLLSDQTFSLAGDTRPLPPNLRIGTPPATFAEKRWWLWGLNREMRRRGVELFHGTDFAVPYLAQRPSVMTIHDLSPWMGPSERGSAPTPGADWQPLATRVRRRTPLLLKRNLASMVITPSRTVRSAVISRFGLAESRVVAIPLAADARFRPVEAAAAATPYFLFVGTLEPRKNLSRLIEAWQEVRKTHRVDLVLAGRIRPDFARPPAAEGLRLLESVPDADLPGLYSGALASVYPSLYEGFGLPVLEALQCGALVITSRDPAIEEVTGGPRQDCALHVDATAVQALRDVMQAVALQPAKFAELRQRGVAQAASFSWEETARRTREVYQTARSLYA